MKYEVYLMLRGYTFAAMTNQQQIDSGNWMMDKTDQAIERSKKVGLSLTIFLFGN